VISIYDPILGIWTNYSLRAYYYDLPDELGGLDYPADLQEEDDLKTHISTATTLADTDSKDADTDTDAEGYRYEEYLDEVLPILIIDQVYDKDRAKWNTSIILNAGGLTDSSVITQKNASKLANLAQKNFPDWVKEVNSLFDIS